jgi:hypothetical protein
MESHFNKLYGNLTYNIGSDTYEMFLNKIGINKHLGYLSFENSIF